MAELTLSAAELRRLRHAAIRIKSKTKVGGAGLTRKVVEKIKEKWKTEEVVRVKVSARRRSICASSTKYSRFILILQQLYPFINLACILVAL